MDPNVPENNSTTKQYWTHEKHLHFLKSIMEASFVRTMLENNGLVLRLDRYLPDSSNSTRDLKSQRRKKHGTPGWNAVGQKVQDKGICLFEDICWGWSIKNKNGAMEGRVDKRSTRRFSSHHKHYDPSQDQVVPQLENRSSSDQDENNLPINIVAIAPPMDPAN